jgi:hypothetical protein
MRIAQFRDRRQNSDMQQLAGSIEVLPAPPWYSKARVRDVAATTPPSSLQRFVFAVREYAARWAFRVLVAAARALSRVAPEKALLAVSQEMNAVPVCLTAAAARLHEPEGLRVERCTIDHLSSSIEQARREHPKAKLCIVTDRLRGSFMGVPAIASVGDAPDELNKAPEVLFICMFDSDERLLSELRRIRRRPNARYLMPGRFIPSSRYFHQNQIAAEVLAEQGRLPMEKFDLSDFENLLQALEATRRLPGSYVEIGVFQGRSANCALSYMERARISKPAWLLDIFEGFTYQEAFHSQDTLWQGGHQETSLAAVKSLLAAYANATVIKSNIITDNLPDGIREISVCNIDVDMYEAVKAAADKIAPHIVRGGIMIFEDAGHTPPLGGARLAVADFIESSAGRDFLPIYMQSGQLFLIRYAGQSAFEPESKSRQSRS